MGWDGQLGQVSSVWHKQEREFIKESQRWQKRLLPSWSFIQIGSWAPIGLMGNIKFILNKQT